MLGGYGYAERDEYSKARGELIEHIRGRLRISYAPEESDQADTRT